VAERKAGVGILRYCTLSVQLHVLAQILRYAGSIFRATHIHTGQEVALKVQFIHHDCPTNQYERKIYPLIQGDIGMPKLYAAGVQDVWDYLAIELLGPSLDSLFRKSGQDMMDMRSVCSIAIQAVGERSFVYCQVLFNNIIRSVAYKPCTSVKFCIGISN
jgi:casein kinase 1